MKTPVLFIPTIIAGLLILATPGGARTWTRASDNKTIEGEFVKKEGDKVTIKKGGRNVEIPIASLSKEDQEFIASQGADKAEEKPGTEGKVSMEVPKGPTDVILSGVHLCCSSCEKGMEKAIENYDDVKLEFDRSAGTVTFKGETGQAVEDALFKVHDAGYYGSTDHPRLKMKKPGGSTKEIEEAEVSGIHMCCGKCEKAVTKALKTVKGIEEHTVQSKKSNFTVKGKFTIAELTKALNDAGMSARRIAPPRD